MNTQITILYFIALAILALMFFIAYEGDKYIKEHNIVLCENICK